MDNVDFEFIGDKGFQEILTRDYKELKACMEVKATKSVLVLSGSIIEAILTEYFLQFHPPGLSEAQILRLTMNNLIDLAVQEKVITDKEKNLASVVKDFRNLIHPGREIRKAETFNEESSNIAVSVLNIIIDSVKVKYLDKYGYSAKEIFDKLKKDWHFQSIYDKVILKLNQNERIKLLEYLVNFEICEKSHWESFMEEGYVINREVYDLDDVKHLVVKLKPLLPNIIVKGYLQRMMKEIETGERLNAYSLYNLFHEDLGLLSDDEQESVVIYVLTLFHDVLEQTREVRDEKTYSTIGKYIRTANAKEALKAFLSYCAVHFNHKDIGKDMDVLEQILNSLSDETKTEAQKYLGKYLSPPEKLPPDMKVFYDEGIRRRVIVVDEV